MTQTAKKVLTIIGRAQFKKSGYVLYRIQSGDHSYDVSLHHGKVSGCVNSVSGEECQGWHYRHECCHAKAVQAREESRAALPTPEPAPTPAPVANEWRDCELCGKPTRSADGVCVRCYGPYAEDEQEQEVVTSEVTTCETETQARAFEAGTRLYHVGKEVVAYDEFLMRWGCTCRETPYGMSYEPCQHTAAVARVLDMEKSAA